MISFKHAEKVSKAIRAVLFGTTLPDWYLGVGIDTSHKEGFTISVCVLTGHSNRITLAKRIDGVKVRVEEREMARKLGRKP